MTTYFNVGAPEDLRLLPTGSREAKDLPDVAALAEADVINEYTRTVVSIDSWAIVTQYRPATQLAGTDRWVYLRGFKEDASQVTDVGFGVAMKRAIAEVIRWRLGDWKTDQRVESEGSTTEGRSRSYRDDARDTFPPGWDRWLEPFDTREPAWGW